MKVSGQMRIVMDEDLYINNNLVSYESNPGTRQMFNVRNNSAGKLFIKMLRVALNKNSYDIRVRGSLSNRVMFRKQGLYISDESVPLKYADRLRVYITEKSTLK